MNLNHNENNNRYLVIGAIAGAAFIGGASWWIWRNWTSSQDSLSKVSSPSLVSDQNIITNNNFPPEPIQRESNVITGPHSQEKSLPEINPNPNPNPKPHLRSPIQPSKGNPPEYSLREETHVSPPKPLSAVNFSGSHKSPVIIPPPRNRDIVNPSVPGLSVIEVHDPEVLLSDPIIKEDTISPLVPRLTIDRISTSSPKSFRTKAMAEWDYTGPEFFEGKPVLLFKANDEISVIFKKTEHSGWGWGELNGVEGYFPLNYCKILGPNLKLDSNVTPRIKQMQEVLKVAVKKD